MKRIATLAWTPRPRAAMSLVALAGCVGCASDGRTALAVGGAVVGLGNTPTTHIGQTYFLGAFDPRDQLPPTIYRIRIRIQGQASALSSTKFASGWVQADLVDSLSGKVSSEARNGAEPTATPTGNGARNEADKSQLDRRLVMFGPEGFREAPKNHRLVVVMGSTPESFFGAMDQALGVVAGATQSSGASAQAQRAIQADLQRLRQERRTLDQFIELATPR
jgi:hypothetical protein